MTDYISGIQKTGFFLEFEINQELKKNGWSIINNKFYEDDVQEVVREIDIVAYKVTLIDDVLFYTTLIISCKKNEENVWALVSQDINWEDPNKQWWPLHMWTNDIPTKEKLSEKDIATRYYHHINNTKAVEVMGPPEVDVFAFQELSKSNGKPQNDKNIFSSLTTLMKAQSYEISALEHRKTDKCIYQFNLISVIDSNLIRVHLSTGSSESKEIETEQLVARYIIKKKEQFFRIRFVQASVFSKYIASYNQLHKSNIELFKTLRDSFYIDSIKNHKKIKLLTPQFLDQIVPVIRQTSGYSLNTDDIKKNFSLLWMESENKLKIFVTEDKKITRSLNQSAQLKSKTEFLLSYLFRYSGNFEYEADDLPF